MIVVVDILQALDAYGSVERVVLANTLGCAPTELDSPLALGVQRGLIGVGAQGWAEDPGSFAGSYTITAAGRKLYSHVLDRFAQQVAGPPGLGIAERFLYGCGDQRPSTAERELVALADDAGLQVMGEPVERDRALMLVSAAVRRWARAALASRETTHAQALGIDSWI